MSAPEHKISQKQIVAASLMAGAGGLLPSLSNIAGKMVVQPVPDMPHIYVTIPLAIFFFIGVVLNFAFNREDWEVGKALIIGISAPGIITNLVSGARSIDAAPPPISAPATSPRAWLDPSRLPSLLGVSSAFAQTPATPPQSSDSKSTNDSSGSISAISESLPLMFSVNIDSDQRDLKLNIPISIKIKAADGPQVGKVIFSINAAPASGLIYIPKGTLSVSVEVVSSHDSSYSGGILGILPEKYAKPSAPIEPSNLDIKLKVNPTSGGDFWWAAGASRIFAVTSASASIDGVPFLETRLTLRCPAVPNSPPIFKTDRVISDTSPRMSGGHDQREFCNRVAASSGINLQNSIVTILSSSESARKSWIGHVDYTYSCTVRIQADPINEDFKISECKDISDTP